VTSFCVAAKIGAAPARRARVISSRPTPVVAGGTSSTFFRSAMMASTVVRL